MGSGKWAYHQTLPWYIDGIAREGLTPHESPDSAADGAVVFFTNTDRHFRNSSRAYLRFPWPEGAQQLNEEAWVIDHPVPPEYLDIFIPDESGKPPVEQDWVPLIEGL